MDRGETTDERQWGRDSRQAGIVGLSRHGSENDKNDEDGALAVTCKRADQRKLAEVSVIGSQGTLTVGLETNETLARDMCKAVMFLKTPLRAAILLKLIVGPES